MYVVTCETAPGKNKKYKNISNILYILSTVTETLFHGGTTNRINYNVDSKQTIITLRRFYPFNHMFTLQCFSFPPL